MANGKWIQLYAFSNKRYLYGTYLLLRLENNIRVYILDLIRIEVIWTILMVNNIIEGARQRVERQGETGKQ